MSGLRIIFLGTPEFAVLSLEALLDAGYEIPVVVTVPDKPSGRGLSPQQSAVKKAALRHNLKVLQPENLRSPEFLAELDRIRADLYVVVAFRILPAEVFDRPERGTINLHASLLPNYRGAAPVNRVIMNGETQTGVTTFFIRKKVDTGGILLQRKTGIGPDETAGELHDRLMTVGAGLLVETVKGIETCTVEPRLQPSGNFPLAPKIEKQDCPINWYRSAQEIHNQIRGLSPVPGAWCFLSNKRLKIIRSELTDSRSDQSPGTLTECSETGYPLVVTGDRKLVKLLEVQPEGKKRMPANAFARGYNLKGAVLH